MIEAVPWHLKAGADIDIFAIEALKLIRDHLDQIPKTNQEFTKEDYYSLKDNPYSNIGLAGYIGYTCSFGATFFGSYAKNKKGRDYVAAAYKNALRQSPLLQGVDLYCCSYDQLDLRGRKVLFYCDPPYANKTGYRHKFDHSKFWDWCRQQRKAGNLVFVSEYEAPSDFVQLFQKEQMYQLDHSTDRKAKNIERLFWLP